MLILVVNDGRWLAMARNSGKDTYPDILYPRKPMRGTRDCINFTFGSAPVVVIQFL
jgi:hypothetical protein